MTKTIKSALTRRLSVAEAKARLSEALRTVGAGPVVIHNRGRDAAVLVAVEDYERLVAETRARAAPMAGFLRDVASLKDRMGGGVDFTPERASLTVQDPFARARR